LYFVVASYRLVAAANRPSLDTTGLIISSDVKTIAVGLNNVGKLTARRGTAVLYALEFETDSPEKIATGDIVGAGTNVSRGMGVTYSLQ
jgi:hypothetical protein